MSTGAPNRAAQTRSSREVAPARQEPAADPKRTGVNARSRDHQRTTLFRIPFKSAMSDADLARLHSDLDMVTYITPKRGVSGAEPGVVPLDFWSGLFLERGDEEDDWLLEARTWNDPPRSLVHEWHVRAALAAREVDPGVAIPPSEHAPAPKSDSRPPGRASKWHRRMGHRRRRLD